MQNLEKLEKSKGVLLFAFNNRDTDYVAIAKQAVALIKRNLKLPVTLVTGITETVDFEVDTLKRINHNAKNYRISTDTGRVVEWANFGRYRAYELSPYDETILLDTDYLVLDDSLLKYFDTEWDYLIPSKNYNIGSGLTKDTMTCYGIDFLWATVVFFRRTQRAQDLFDMVGRIQRNYGYYQQLFNILPANFRNDYAFAMASIILNGYQYAPSTILPVTITTITDPIVSMQRQGNLLTITTYTTGHAVPVTNLHVMSKDYLSGQSFKDFVNAT